MAAKESLLSLLHERAAQRMLAMLDDPEGIKAADLAVITKFLKDNGINCEAEASDPMKKLAAKVGNVVQFPFSPDEAAHG